MLWHRQAIFESKGDKLSFSAECRIRTHQGLRHQIASRLNARWQTDWAIEDQPKTWTRQLVPIISEHSAHSTPQPFWHSHLALAIYMFVVVSFDALAQASDIRIERRQVFFLCWMQDSNLSGSQTPNRQQTQCPLTNRLSYRGSSKKLELDGSSLWSASFQPTRPHSRFGIRTRLWRYTCLLLLICTHMGSISIKLHLKQILIYTYYTRTKYCFLIIQSHHLFPCL